MNPFGDTAKMLRRFMRLRNSQARKEERPLASFNTVKQEWKKLSPNDRAALRKSLAQEKQ